MELEDGGTVVDGADREGVVLVDENRELEVDSGNVDVELGKSDEELNVDSSVSREVTVEEELMDENVEEDEKKDEEDEEDDELSKSEELDDTEELDDAASDRDSSALLDAEEDDETADDDDENDDEDDSDELTSSSVAELSKAELRRSLDSRRVASSQLLRLDNSTASDRLLVDMEDADDEVVLGEADFEELVLVSAPVFVFWLLSLGVEMVDRRAVRDASDVGVALLERESSGGRDDALSSDVGSAEDETLFSVARLMSTSSGKSGASRGAEAAGQRNGRV